MALAIAAGSGLATCIQSIGRHGVKEYQVCKRCGGAGLIRGVGFWMGVEHCPECAASGFSRWRTNDKPWNGRSLPESTTAPVE